MVAVCSPGVTSSRIWVMANLDELRPALAEVLGKLLSPDPGERTLAEQQLKALQVTEGEVKMRGSGGGRHTSTRVPLGPGGIERSHPLFYKT